MLATQIMHPLLLQRILPFQRLQFSFQLRGLLFLDLIRLGLRVLPFPLLILFSRERLHNRLGFRRGTGRCRRARVAPATRSVGTAPATRGVGTAPTPGSRGFPRRRVTPSAGRCSPNSTRGFAPASSVGGRRRGSTRRFRGRFSPARAPATKTPFLYDETA